jgi:4-hydroxy-tetrahydrodipicolinate reductase
MKIAIIGYGKMGRMIESIATQKGHSIGSRIDIDSQDLLSPENLRKHDVAIEFSTPGTAVDNVIKCLEAGLPVVSGTTGWKEQLDGVIKRCQELDGTLLYASNFSLGVNILFYLNQHLAAIMNRREQYNVRISEIHHTQKLDAPSGTAITLAEGILEEYRNKKGWSLKETGQTRGNTVNQTEDSLQNAGKAKDHILIEAIRAGTVTGVHEITYESDFDSLSIRHSAKDRRGFANGAVLAAEYIHDKKGFFTMKDVLDI